MLYLFWLLSSIDCFMRIYYCTLLVCKSTLIHSAQKMTNRAINCTDLRSMPPSREALRHSGGDSLLFTSAMVTLYLEVELSSDSRPGTEQNKSVGFTTQVPPAHKHTPGSTWASVETHVQQKSLNWPFNSHTHFIFLLTLPLNYHKLKMQPLWSLPYNSVSLLPKINFARTKNNASTFSLFGPFLMVFLLKACSVELKSAETVFGTVLENWLCYLNTRPPPGFQLIQGWEHDIMDKLYL